MVVRRALALLMAVCAALVVSPASPADAARLSRPFDGAGTWVSMFSGDAIWDRPARHVQQMRARGVRTLYLQTASSSSPVGTDLYRRAALARFLHAAHARDMRVVAWYLPPLRRVGRERDRALAAIRFRTVRGDRFDGFALDIEPSATTPRGASRDTNLRRLSRRLRASVGDHYPLGAIFPSPVGMERVPRYWPDFPFGIIGRFYDVALPMSYSTNRAHGPAATYAYTADNVAILRERLGPEQAIHVIGGQAARLSRRETRAFVQACHDTGVSGASLYHYSGYGPEDWQEMAALAH